MQEYLEQHKLQLVDSLDSIRGRYVQAKEKLEKGRLLIVSEPLGTIILPENMKEYCNYCFCKNPRQRCSQCKKSYFCDVQCFKKAWASHHQFTCKHDIDPQMEMLEKVALNIERYRRLEKEEGTEKKLVDITIEAFSNLMGHDKLQSPQTRNAYRLLSKKVLEKPYMRDITTDIDTLVHYLCVFASNNFTLDDQEMFTIGQGTYPIASLFNHSCRPNAVVLFEGAIAKIQAIEDIQPNTEITIAYLDAAHSRKYRKSSLKEKYFFDCQCVRCQPHPECKFLSKVDELLGEEEDIWERVAEVSGKGNSRSAKIMQQVTDDWDVTILSKSNNLDVNFNIAHYTHYFINKDLTNLTNLEVISRHSDLCSLSMLSTCSRLFYDSMNEENWTHAVCLGMYVLVQYSIIYPPFHPMLAQHYLILAKSNWNAFIQSNNSLYENYSRKWTLLAQQTIPIAFGKRGSLWKETVELASLQ